MELTKSEKQAIEEYLARKGLPSGSALTFDDVAIPDRYSTVRSRSEIRDFRSYLTNSFHLNIPIVSSNMESVTGAEMAIALAREGGLGFLPQMVPLEARLEMIRKIKRTDCAFIEKPLTIGPEKTLHDAKCLMQETGISSLVVVDKSFRPVGILSTRDWKYEKNEKVKVRDLMGGKKKLIVMPGSVKFEKAATMLRANKVEKLPLVDKKGKLTGLITAHGLFYTMHYPRALRDDQGRFLAAASIGVGRMFEKRHLKEVELQLKEGASILLIDTARAFSVNAVEALKAIKKTFPKLPVVIGNVCTPEGAKLLFENGADAVKVNQGRGHVCRTSEMGVGIPQLTAIAKCSVIAKQYGGKIVGDGGMKNVGDMVKALAAGADVLMTGYLLVGTNESAAQTYVNRRGLPVKNYEGSASFHAQAKRITRGNLDRLRRPEGVTEEVPVVGSVAEKIEDMLNAFRSAMSYSGVRTIKELQEDVVFEKQTRAGLVEGTKGE
ncbi:MAG: IMP dehydrogenase [Patescibacteria group bacterium]